MHLFLGADYGATEAFTAAVRMDPDFALGHAALGRSSMMEGRIPDAKDAIAKTQALADPSDECARTRKLRRPMLTGSPLVQGML